MKKSLIATLALAGALAACSGSSSSKTTATTRPFQRGTINVNTVETITYKVTSAGPTTLVTYTDPHDGSAQQVKGTALWTKTWQNVPEGTNLAVIVQSPSGQGITCSIIDGGKVLDSHTTTDSNITECSGAV